MVNKLRAGALAAIHAAGQATLSSAGPAGVQASVVPCFVHHGRVFALVPSTADHLFNIEHAAEVTLTTPEWSLRGDASVRAPAALGDGAALRGPLALARAEALVFLEIAPRRMQLFPTATSPFPATVDFADVPSCALARGQ